MPKFVNTLRHRVYVEHPDKGLVRVISGQEVEASGAFADRLEATPGVVNVATKEGKERLEKFEATQANLDNFGPHAYPAEGGGGTVTTESADAEKKSSPRKSSPKKSSSKSGASKS